MGIESAYLAGLLTGALIGIPVGLLLGIIVIPRAVDLWAVVVRAAHRSHGR